MILGLAVAGRAAPSRDAASPVPPKTPSLSDKAAVGRSGKVVETMDAGGYTYVCLEKNGEKTWVAVPQMKVAVGASLSFQPGVVMLNFSSPSLDRTFERIVFSPGPSSAGKSSMPAGHPALPAGTTGSKAQVPSKEKAVKVEKAKGPNAYTVAEVHAKRSALNKKTVRVKGTVVKVNRNIMDRNWVHLQDGSGNRKKGTHNIVATSKETPSVGSVVTASGIVAKDRDFGGGYTYTVIIEEATFTE